MLKKKLALVLAMAMAASLALSGCGNPHASSSGSGSLEADLAEPAQRPRVAARVKRLFWPPEAPPVLTTAWVLVCVLC